MADLKGNIQRLEQRLRDSGVARVGYVYARYHTKKRNAEGKAYLVESPRGGETTVILSDSTGGIIDKLTVKCRSTEVFHKNKGRVYALSAICKKRGVNVRSYDVANTEVNVQL